MARRSSAASTSTLPSTLSVKSAQTPWERSIGDTRLELDVRTPPRLARTASTSTKYDAFISQIGSVESIGADALFVKHTVSEVRAIQQRLRYVAMPMCTEGNYPYMIFFTLRSDAENKQEELRLMVGCVKSSPFKCGH